MMKDAIQEKNQNEVQDVINDTIQNVDIVQLKPHPRNETIYGQEDVSDLVTQIEERGKIVIPLIVNKDYVIISGHRRWKAAQELHHQTVPCEIRTFDSLEDELEFLLHSNVSRKKTWEQKAREGMVLEEVLLKQSLERRKANLKQNQTATDVEHSSISDESVNDNSDNTKSNKKEMVLTRDKVAEALKIGSGKLYTNIKEVVNRIDELKLQKNHDDVELFVTILNRSASAAHDLLKVDFSKLTDENKSDLKCGKASPRSFISSEKDSKAKSVSNDNSALICLKKIERSIKTLKKYAPFTKNTKKNQKILEQIESHINNLQSILSTSESSEAESK